MVLLGPTSDLAIRPFWRARAINTELDPGATVSIVQDAEPCRERRVGGKVKVLVRQDGSAHVVQWGQAVLDWS